jgi:predicted  nucleic acid-binding Zn-ribbon protein
MSDPKDVEIQRLKRQITQLEGELGEALYELKAAKKEIQRLKGELEAKGKKKKPKAK